MILDWRPEKKRSDRSRPREPRYAFALRAASPSGKDPT
jgi:hypothetical protein